MLVRLSLAVLAVVLAAAAAVHALSSVPRHLYPPQSFLHASSQSACVSPSSCGEALYLSPFIANGSISEGRSLAAMQQPPNSGFTGELGWSGYLQSNPDTNNQIFFWFFPAQNGDTTAPVLLWLQGGPGASDMWGLFGEVGAVTVNASTSLVGRGANSWNSKYAMLFVDQPAGTGWSQLGDPSHPVNTESQVGTELIAVLTQWYQLFPEYTTNELYVVGESYGGKYAPTCAYAIHQHNSAGHPNTPTPIPLAGLIIADGWSDPETAMPAYAPLLYNFGGLVNPEQAAQIAQVMATAEQYRAAGQLQTAFGYWNSFWADYNPTNFISGFTNMTGSTDPENLSDSADDRPFWGYISSFLGLDSTRKMLHVGQNPFSAVDIYGSFVGSGDFMDSVRDILPVLFNNYRVLVYNGGFDGICGGTGTDALLQVLVDNSEWSGGEQFSVAPRLIWKINPQTDVEVSGFAQEVWSAAAAESAEELQFARVIVRNAGHMLPADQPARAYDMITRFISGRGFSD